LCLSQNSATLTCQGLARSLVSKSVGRRFDSDRQLCFKSLYSLTGVEAFSFSSGLLPNRLCVAEAFSYPTVVERCDEKCHAHSHPRRSNETLIQDGSSDLTRSWIFKNKGFSTEPKKSGLKIIPCMIICSLFLLTTEQAFCGTTTEPTAVSFNYSSGLASFYGVECCRYNPSKGCPTASGRSLYSLVKDGTPYAAAWGIPFGSKVKVTNLENNKSVTVIILDRGPNKRFRPRRIIDLSKSAFSKIASPRQGTIKVKVEVLNVRKRSRN
jgi:rare lipoprotein A